MADTADVSKFELPNHVGQRRMVYQSVGDQLDALWKGGEALEQMREKIREIKMKYPKLDNKSFL